MKKYADHALSSKTTVLVCDTLRIGGAERLILDQAYKLSDLNKKVVILILSAKPVSTTLTFLELEKNLISSKNIQVHYFSGRKSQQFKNFFLFLKNVNVEIVISHSLRGTVFFSVIKRITRKSYFVITTLHQLLCLSAPLQRMKRVAYSQFSDVLFAFSSALVCEWEYKRRHNLFFRLLTLRKGIELCRNGVYLDRLKPVEITASSEIKRFLFIGRLTSWKSLSSFLEVFLQFEFQKIRALIMTPNDPTEYLQIINQKSRESIDIEIGKSVSQVQFNSNDLHLYHTNYGPNSRFTEPVSINVLEMACLGISSVISRNGNLTWPELLELKLLVEVDWTDLDLSTSIIKKQISNQEIKKYDKARELIDIKNNLHQIFAAARVEL